MTEETNEAEFITATVGSQLFGLPILRVQDVFAPDRITRVPLAAPDIAGVLNLRGRIVTLIDLRRRLGLGGREQGAQAMAVGVESQGESYGLLIDSIGEVLKLPEAGREPNPLNLDPKLAAVSAGIYRLETQLLVIVDVDRVLDTGAVPVAA
jgi:purine-binding chemotaxis protein CheW